MHNPIRNTVGQIADNRGVLYPVTAAVNHYPEGWTVAAEWAALSKAKAGEKLTDAEELLIQAWSHRIYPPKWNREEEEAALAKWRANKALTHSEKSYLTAWTNRNNIKNSLDVLGYDAHEVHGFEGVDQLHGNLHNHPCGCVVHMVFDHHKRHDLKPEHVRPHRAEEQCHRHAHHKDVQALHKAISDEHIAAAAVAAAFSPKDKSGQH